MLEILIPPLLALEVSELLLKLKGKIEELVLDAVTIVDSAYYYNFFPSTMKNNLCCLNIIMQILHVLSIITWKK